MDMRIAALLCAGILACGVGMGCSESGKEAERAESRIEQDAKTAAGEVEKGAEVAGGEIEKGAETAASNLEGSTETMEETYEEKREEGEGRVEAAGDAYNKMLEKDGLDPR